MTSKLIIKNPSLIIRETSISDSDLPMVVKYLPLIASGSVLCLPIEETYTTTFVVTTVQVTPVNRGDSCSMCLKHNHPQE